MGRHATPGTGRPEPDAGFWVRLAAALVVVGLVTTYVLMRGDDTRTATPAPGRTSTASPSTTAPASGATPTPTPTPTETGPSPARRPPTLRFEVLRPSYITVRVPGGRTLVSRLFRKGETRRFDRPVLQVVNGRPSAVRFVVNGRARQPGPAEEPETFTVRRR